MYVDIDIEPHNLSEAELLDCVKYTTEVAYNHAIEARQAALEACARAGTYLDKAKQTETDARQLLDLLCQLKEQGSEAWNLKTIIHMAEITACGSAHEANKAAAECYKQSKIALDKSEQTWVKAHQLQYALYDLQLELETTP